MSCNIMYENLDELQLNAKCTKLYELNEHLEKKCSKLEGDIQTLMSEILQMKAVEKNLCRNISILLSTAQNEIGRKDQIITDLRAQLDSIAFRRKVHNFMNNAVVDEVKPSNEKCDNREIDFCLKEQKEKEVIKKRNAENSPVRKVSHNRDRYERKGRHHDVLKRKRSNTPDRNNRRRSVTPNRNNRRKSVTPDRNNRRRSVTPDRNNRRRSITSSRKNKRRSITPDKKNRRRSISPDRNNRRRSITPGRNNRRRSRERRRSQENFSRRKSVTPERKRKARNSKERYLGQKSISPERRRVRSGEHSQREAGKRSRSRSKSSSGQCDGDLGKTSLGQSLLKDFNKSLCSNRNDIGTKVVKNVQIKVKVKSDSNEVKKHVKVPNDDCLASNEQKAEVPDITETIKIIKEEMCQDNQGNKVNNFKNGDANIDSIKVIVNDQERIVVSDISVQNDLSTETQLDQFGSINIAHNQVKTKNVRRPTKRRCTVMLIE